MISQRVRSSSDPPGAPRRWHRRAACPSPSRRRRSELDDRLPQELEEALRLLGRADVGRGDDLEQRRATAVVVDERVLGTADPSRLAAHVDRLRRILLEMGPNDPDLEVALRHGHYHPAIFARWHIVLGDLISLRQVGVEVVLAGEHGAGRDLAAEREPELDRPLDRGPVHHRERAGEPEADGARLGVLPARSPRCSGRTSSCASSAARGSRGPRPSPRPPPPPSRSRRSRSGTVSKPFARSSAWPARNTLFRAGHALERAIGFDPVPERRRLERLGDGGGLGDRRRARDPRAAEDAHEDVLPLRGRIRGGRTPRRAPCASASRARSR